MLQAEIDAVGNRIFGMLLSLLRPFGRAYPCGGGDPQMEPAPAQRIEIAAGWQGERMWFGLQQWLRCRPGAPVVFSWLLPLPPDAAVYDLSLEASGPGAAANLHERREARALFEEARQEKRAGVLLTEDTPGFFGLQVAAAGGTAVGLRFRATCPFPGGAMSRGGQVAVHCETRRADPGDKPASSEARVVRLGTGHALDCLVGVRRECRSRSSDTIQAGEQRIDAGVLVAHDGADGAAALFRGFLAGRQLRLWAKLGTPSSCTSLEEAGCGEIRSLMAEYRSPGCSEAERRGLAAKVADLGQRAGVATLWTSLVATAGCGSFEGERASYAA